VGVVPAEVSQAGAPISASASQAVDFMTCGWLEKQSGGHSSVAALAGGRKRKLTFGQAVMKWDIRFCVLGIDERTCEAVLKYYKNKEEWQAQMQPKGTVPLGTAHVELLRSMEEPVDYRMTIRVSERCYSFRASLKDLKLWMGFVRACTLCSAARWTPQQLLEFVALAGVTDDMVNIILQSGLDGRQLAGCRTMLEMMPMFGITAADSAPSSPRYLLAKDVEKIFDKFDGYRMYASTLKLTSTLSNLEVVAKQRALNPMEAEQQERFSWVMRITTAAPSAIEVVKAAAQANSSSAPDLAAKQDDEFNPRSGSEEEDDWDDFQVAPLPAPALAGAAEVLPSGMTAAGVARRRASLAPQPSLPEVDHNIGAKAMSVSLEMESSITADFDGGGGAFMAAVEEDV
jgi:hypothetical protein